MSMSLETRSNSALFKRAEQLKRWEESDTNREPASPKQKSRKVKFSSGCVFLAACAAGDKDEVLKLLEKGADIDTPNVDGLTALHQACIDDNLDMVEFLVEHGADVNRGDDEGWTPLHATASCGFLYIAKYLIEKGANVDAVNNDGELPIDIAECQKMEDLLKEEIDKRGINCDAARNDEELAMLRDAKEWLASKSSLVNVPHPKNGATALHVAASKGYMDVMRILLQCGADIDSQDVDGWTPLHAAAHWGQKDACQLLVEKLADMDSKNYVGQTPFDLSDTDMLHCLEDLRKKQNKEEVNKRKSKKRAEIEDRNAEAETPSKVQKVEVQIKESAENKNSDNIEKKNRVNETLSISNKEAEKPPPVPAKQINTAEENPSWRKEVSKPNKPEAISPVKSSVSFKEYNKNSSDMSNENDVSLRRANSFQSDEESAKDDVNEVSGSTISTAASSPAKLTSPTSSPQSNNQQPLRRSFVPPVRDEESETQRKAHAKRVRETRRSTQGVTLEEIKSAEQFVKNKNQPNNNNNESSGTNGESNKEITVTATITTATPTVITPRESEETPMTHERRPSWRLKVDGGSKFKLEDASKPETPSTPSFIRRSNALSNSSQRPSSAPIDTGDTTTITLSLRRPKSMEEKEQDKENDVRNAQATLATQAAIQRRRRPKRRSTGVVSFDNVDDLDQDKDPSGGGDGNESCQLNHQESGSDRNSRSRISSTVDIRNENGEIDYKKLYEQQLTENDRLKDKLRKTEEDLRETKQTLEKINVVTSKNSLSELEKRERRAMERKLSEMEEELKNLENLKSENQRLKDENGALIRVISKLSK